MCVGSFQSGQEQVSKSSTVPGQICILNAVGTAKPQICILNAVGTAKSLAYAVYFQGLPMHSNKSQLFDFQDLLGG